MVEYTPIRFSRAAKWATVAVVVFLTVVLLRSVTHILLPFIWAIILAYIFHPLITSLTKRTKMRRGFWVLTLYIVLIGAMSIAVTALVPLITDQLNALIDETTRTGGYVDQAAAFFSQTQAIDLGFGIKIDIKEIEQELGNAIKAAVTEIPAAVPDIFVTLIESFIHLLVFLVSTFYLLLHAEKIMTGFYSLVPAEHRGEIKALVGSIDRVLGAYIRGQLLLILLMSTASFIVLTILGVKYALIIAIATGILEIIPIVGPYLATGIASLVALLQGTTPFGWEPWVLALVVILCYFALRQAEDHLVIPALLGHIVDLHPVIVLFSILAGGVLAGALGLLVAIPIAAVFKIILVYLYRKLIDAPVPTSDDGDELTSSGASATAALGSQSSGAPASS